MAPLERLAGACRRVDATLRQLTPDVLMIAGAGAIAYGAWLLHPAAGFVVGGGFTLAAGVLGARSAP